MPEKPSDTPEKRPDELGKRSFTLSKWLHAGDAEEVSPGVMQPRAARRAKGVRRMMEMLASPVAPL